MKNFYSKTILLCLLSLVSITSSAYNCEVNGVYYNLNKTNKTASVTYKSYSSANGYNKDYTHTTITIPSSITVGTVKYMVTSISEYAFYGCRGLTSVTIPNSVTEIGNYAFYYCSGLTSVTIPNSVTEIGYRAFTGCSGLTSVTIGNSVTSIDFLAFEGCSGLEKVIVPSIDLAAWCKISFGGYSSNPLYYAHHLYSDENTEITNLIIPDGVTSIGGSAFFGCSSLTSVTIPNSVTSIGEYAFYGCSGLTSVTIPGSVTSISNYAFNGCSSLTDLTFSDGDDTLKLDAQFDVYRESVEHPFMGCPIEKAYLGRTLDCYYVEILNEITWSTYRVFISPFYRCESLKELTIGNGVKSIGGDAFSGCSGLEKVIVSDLAAWCRISFYSNPLSYAGHLYSDENTEITNLIIPDGVTEIGYGAFTGCRGLTSVTIPNSVTSIGEYAFSACRGLTSVTIPNSVTEIGDDAFWDCI